MSERRPIAWSALVALALAVAVAVLWTVLAPTPPADVAGDLLVSDRAPEFQAAQDGTFALLALAAGLVHGTFVLRSPRLPIAAAALGAGLLASVLAWQLGALLGPPSAGEQQAAADGAVVAPLDLHALGVLGVWPAATATVVFVGLLLSGSRQR